MKKLGFLVLCLSMMLTNLKIAYAEEVTACHEKLYYSKKDWVDAINFFDVEFDNATIISNSKLVSISFNGFGPYMINGIGNDLYHVSSDNLNGNKPLVQKANNEYGEFHSTFAMKFGRNIKVYDFDLELSVIDEDGSIKPYVIYVDSVNEGIKLVHTEYSDGKINIDLNGEVIKAMYIKALNPSKTYTYTLSLFQINKYQLYEHIAWVSEYIPNTDTITQTYCDSSGVFSPHDSMVWQKSQYTIFSPSIKVLNDEADYVEVDYWNRYNDGYKIGIAKDSPPDYIAMYLWTEGGNGGKLTPTFGYTPSNKPFIWQRNDNRYIALQDENEYIKTDKVIDGRNVYIRVYADMVNCNGNCSYENKTFGHTNTLINNAYDTYVYTYTKEATEELAYITNIKFYLLDESGQRIKLIDEISGDSTTDLEKRFSEIVIEDNGKWKVEALMSNALGDTTSVISGLYYVDNAAPTVSFSPNEYYESHENIEVTIKVNDDASGLKAWRYALSNDEGKTYGEYSEYIYDETHTITILDSGKNMIKVEAIDNATNLGISYSGIYEILANPPTLKLKTNYYYKDTDVYVDELLNNARAIDEIEGDISDRVQVISIEYADGSVDTNPSFLNTNEVQDVLITYYVKNSQGLSTTNSKYYAIIDKHGEFTSEEEADIYTRFIDDANKNTLNEQSIWQTNSEYSRQLESILKEKNIIKQIIIKGEN